MKFQENPLNRSLHTKKRYFVLQVKCPSVLSNRNRTYIECSAHVQSARFEFSGKSVE